MVRLNGTQQVRLRFHLYIMRMPHANATKNQKHRISIRVLPFVRMWMWMRMWSTTMTKWIPLWAISPNANGLSDWKSLHTQGRCRVAHASQGENYTGPLISFVIRIRHHIRIMYKWNLSFRQLTECNIASINHSNYNAESLLVARCNKIGLALFCWDAVAMLSTRTNENEPLWSCDLIP